MDSLMKLCLPPAEGLKILRLESHFNIELGPDSLKVYLLVLTFTTQSQVKVTTKHSCAEMDARPHTSLASKIKDAALFQQARVDFGLIEAHV